MRTFSGDFRSYLINRFTGWRDDHLKGPVEPDRLVLGDGGREGVEHVLGLRERFLTHETPSVAYEVDGVDCFETLPR